MSSLSFLNRRRSLAPSTRDTIPPPDLPQHVGPRPHIPSEPQSLDHTSIYQNAAPSESTTLSRTPSKSGQLMKRVSTLFSGRKRMKPFTGTLAPISSTSFNKDKKRKKGKPSSTSSGAAASGTLSPLTSRASMSSASSCDSIDDIRRPSGLGRSVSLTSQRSLSGESRGTVLDPKERSELVEKGGGGDEDGIGAPMVAFDKLRSISSPNLLGRRGSQTSRNAPFSFLIKSLVPPTHAKRHSMGLSQLLTIPVKLDKSWPLSPRLPPTPSQRSVPSIPAEVWSMILILLPRHEIANMATLSRGISLAARHALYGCLGDIGTLKLDAFQKLTKLLVSRPDLTDMVHTFICRQWPWLCTSKTSNRASDQENFGLIASSMTAFTLAFQRMHHLTTLVLPSFDLPLLRHHSAFGLKSLTFLNSDMSPEELVEMFNWLDGQINITSLVFPNLFDAPSIKLYGNIILQLPLATTDATEGDGSVIPFPSCSKTKSATDSAIPSTTPSLIQDDAATAPAGTSRLTTSSTILPILRTIQAPPEIVSLLAAPLSSPVNFHREQRQPRIQEPFAHNGFSNFGLAAPSISPPENVPFHRRPLEKVVLNINCSLYMGLRPAAIMSALLGQDDCNQVCPTQPGEGRGFPPGGLRSLGLKFGPGMDKRTIEKVLAAAGSTLGGIPNGRKQDSDDEHEQGSTGDGLDVLEVELTSTDSGLAITAEETTYKAINSVLPRYQCLRTLCLTSSILPDPNPPLNPRRTSVSLTPLILTHTAAALASFPPAPLTIITPDSSKDSERDPLFPSLPSPGPEGNTPPSPFGTRLFPTPPQGLSPLTPGSRYAISARNSNRTSLSGAGSSPGSTDVNTIAEVGKMEMSALEQAHLKNWQRQCPTLRVIRFLSGARWIRSASDSPDQIMHGVEHGDTLGNSESGDGPAIP